MASRPLAFVLLVALVVALPTTAAASDDPKVQEHAKACLDALGIDTADPADRTSTCVVAYAHVADAITTAPLTTQRPPDDLAHAEFGWMTPTITPHWDLHHYAFRLEGGPVSYQDGAFTRAHLPLLNTLHLVEERPLLVRLHFTADQVVPLFEMEDPLEAGTHPCVHLQVRLVALFDRDEPGHVLSEVETTGHIARPGAPVPTLTCADASTFTIDEEGITTFDLELPTRVRALQGDHATLLQVRVYTVRSDGEEVTLPGVRLVQGPDHLNHVVLPIHDAIAVEEVESSWFEDRLYSTATIFSPWGQYDVDLETLQFRIISSDGTQIAQARPELVAEPTLRISSCHGCDLQPVRITYPLDLHKAALPDDTYRIQIVAENMQHSARASAEHIFTIRDDGTLLTLYDQDDRMVSMHVLGKTTNVSVPGPHLALVLLGLLGLLMRHRTR